MSALEIPAEFGRVIPHPSTPCSQCGRTTIAIAKDEPEPLCYLCRIDDQTLELAFARYAVTELVVSIERQNYALPRFGIQRGEIDSCDLVQTMRHAEEVDRDARLCLRLTWAFAGFEALLLIIAAAATR